MAEILPRRGSGWTAAAAEFIQRLAAPLIDSMQWVTDMEQLMAERGGPSAPISMFDEADKINALLAWWENDPNARHRSLDTITREVPEFVELRSRAFSHQRTLQSHKALEFVAIDRLRETLDDKLQEGKAEELSAVLADFENRYPDIVGSAKLKPTCSTTCRSRSRSSRAIGCRPAKVWPRRFPDAAVSSARRACGCQSVAGRGCFDQVPPGVRGLARRRFRPGYSLLQELSATRWAEPARASIAK